MIQFAQTIRSRVPSGQALAGLTVLFAAFVILPMGVFGFELFRHVCANQQLRAVCDAAALAGASKLASIQPNVADRAAEQLQALQSAKNVFCRNTVVDHSLSQSQFQFVVAPSPVSSPAGHAVVFADLCDSNGQIVQPGGNATAVKVTAFYGYQPAFGNLINVRTVTIAADSTAGLPSFDIVLCFDISGSIDDETPVSLVKRYWNGNRVDYQMPPTSQGRICDIFQPTIAGTRVNGVPPQNLSSASYRATDPFSGSGNTNPHFFSESPSKDFPGNQMYGLRANLSFGAIAAGQETGCPPGNFDPKVPTSRLGNGVNPDQVPTGFTDLVVNLDGRPQFQGWTSPDGYAFPDVATLVEAARGNLDLTTKQLKVSQGNSTANIDSGTIPAPRPGYQAAYRKRAMELISPMQQAKQAAANFLATMNTNCDAHFSIIAFSDGVGKDANSVWTTAGTTYGATNNLVDEHWPGGGTGTFPLPLVHLGDSAGQSDNYTGSLNAVSHVVPTGMTDMAAAIDKAYAELTSSNVRPQARRAIVFFTDGIPNIPLTADWGKAVGCACGAAAQCAKAGIPIYSIGLSTNPQVEPYEAAVLGDSSTQPPPPPSFGISRITGGIYVPVNDANKLDEAFQTIERSLVRLK